MIVCHCRVVTDRAVADAVGDGARTLAGGLPGHRRRPGLRVLRLLAQAAGVRACARPSVPTWRSTLQPVSPRVVELLNEALTFELTVTNTYFLHARMLDNWGLGRLGKVFYDLSIDEMKDADALINRILMFDGHPNVQRLGSITVGEDARGDAPPRARERERPRSPSSTPAPRSATTSATTAPPRCSRRWSATRSGTPTGSRASSTRSTASACPQYLAQMVVTDTP